ncbi:hypothetical protein, partial [Hyphomicrobium sp.]|uniref:hypothetical protein n=1 Tax=Hyphomicrobium sp. TaxID=82 RepID=UPI002FDF8381
LNKRYGLTYKVFLVPTVEEFEALLKAHGVGNGSDYDRSRRTIFEAWRAGPAGHGGIVLKKASLKLRGGLGDAGDPSSANPLFAINDSVVVHVSHPANGYLIVLNDDMASNRVVCMAPSCYAPYLAANGRSSVIPAEDVEPSVIPMYGPGGHYRLYALWTATEPAQLGFAGPAAAMVSAPYLLSLTDFQQFASYVDHQRRSRRQEGANHHRTQLLIADYWVQSGTAQGP